MKGEVGMKEVWRGLLCRLEYASREGGAMCGVERRGKMNMRPLLACI